MVKCNANNCDNSKSYSYCSYHERCLSKLQDYYGSSTIPNIQEIEAFETWFSGNYDSSNSLYPYWVWIVVYEPAVKSMGEILSAIIYNNWSSLSYARQRVQELKKKLQNGSFHATPMLEFHPKSNSCEYFSNLITSPYVISTVIPFKSEDIEYIEDSLMYESSSRRISPEYPDDPGDYLKPLDVVKVKKNKATNDYYHFGIYIGNKQICHFSDPYSKKSTDNMRVRITSWKDFMNEWVYSSNGVISRIHPVVPFKNFKQIAENIAWDEANKHGDGEYCLANNNCEHYINSRIFGLNYSKQVEERSSKARENSHRKGLFNYGPKCYECRQGKVNNGKSGSFISRNELEKNTSKLYNWRSQEIVRKYEIEVLSKQDFRVM